MKGTRTVRFSSVTARNFEFVALILVVSAIIAGAGCAGVATPTSSSAQSAPGAQVNAHSVVLAWNPSAGAVGYNVYRSTQSGAFYTLLTPSAIPATSFTDLSLARGQTYFYVVTAVDSAFRESGYSKEVSAAIPTT